MRFALMVATALLLAFSQLASAAPGACERFDKNRAPQIADLLPIDCVSPMELRVGTYRSTILLSEARPEIRSFIATVNDRLAQAKAGRRLTDADLANDRRYRNMTQLLLSLGYPLAKMGLTLQLAIDSAFAGKAQGYIEVIDANEESHREQERIAAAEEKKAQERHEADLRGADFEKHRVALAAHGAPIKMIRAPSLASWA
jgi:hypothetical protein